MFHTTSVGFSQNLTLSDLFFNFLGLILMSNLNKDILIGLLFIIGIWSFISGQFIISTVLFAGAAIYSNVVMRPVKR